MPRGIYDRSKARRRAPTNGRTTTSASVSGRIAQLSKELAALSEEVKRSEGLQAAVAQYMAGASTGAAAAAPRRRGRPPGSKNRSKTGGAATTTRRRGRPRKTSVATAAPRRRGRPPKNATPAG